MTSTNMTTARNVTRKVRTYTDAEGVTHDVRNGGWFTRCDISIGANHSGAMPGWPSPPKQDYVAKMVTCLECIVMEDS